MNHVILGAKDGYPVVFGHGWGRDHRDFIPVAELLGNVARSILLDLPGFGQSKRPDAAWGTQDYAADARAFLERELGITRFIWVGHSFGGRVGLRMAQMPDSPLSHLFIVAGAGVPRRIGLTQCITTKYRGWTFKRRKASINNEADLIALEAEFGSADYVASRLSGLRDTFTKIIQENQSDQLRSVKCPTSLLYGGRDTETPPEIGQLIHRLIPQSTYLECAEFDHHTILSRGRHQLTLMIRDAVKELARC